jgi:hypothetical protein
MNEAMSLDEARSRVKQAVVEVLSRGDGSPERLQQLRKPENDALFGAMIDQAVETQLERERHE